jgi:hypothetical protein
MEMWDIIPGSPEPGGFGLDQIVQFLSYIWWFLSSGIFEVFHDVFAKLFEYGMIFYWSVKVAAIGFMWGVGQSLMESMRITEYIELMFAHFDSQTLAGLMWLRVPEFVNTVVSAYVTRWVMSTVSGLINFG